MEKIEQSEIDEILLELPEQERKDVDFYFNLFSLFVIREPRAAALAICILGARMQNKLAEAGVIE